MKLTGAAILVSRGMKLLQAAPAAYPYRSAAEGVGPGAVLKQKGKTMATAEEALQKMREICLALPDTREGGHFGQTAFYVKNKLFATCGEKHGLCEITFGLEPDHAAALVENDPRFKPYSRDKRG